MMGGSRRIEDRICSFLRTRTVKKRTIIIGLKSDNCSREMLLRVLSLIVAPGDNVLAVHVQETNDTFDPNTFHMHEDLCKSKQVDFQVKICQGSSHISELTHQVRVNFATILVLGCNSLWPKDSVVANCLKGLPPTCSLLVMDSGGRILIQRQGTSQQGSTREVSQPSLSYTSKYTSYDQSGTARQLQKSSTMPALSTSPKVRQADNMEPQIVKKTMQPTLSASPTVRQADNRETQIVKKTMQPALSTSPTVRQADNMEPQIVKKTLQFSDFMPQKPLQRLAHLEAKKSSRRFSLQELNRATDNFNPVMVIGEGGHSKVYQAKLENGRPAAVKVLKCTHFSAEDLLQEVELLSAMNHENIVQIIGYCYGKEMHAVVYNLLKDSLKRKLGQLRWSERMGVAIGLAKALDYLHHSCNPPIIHRDVKSSNILLSENCQPHLSDFGAAMVHHKLQQAAANTKPFRVIGTFGYLAPEYIMYGKVDEKTDVYSYGVVLLELITGKQAIQTSQASNHESLVLWARSLLGCGLCEHLIDPNLKGEYKKEEMKTMMIAARLCLMHSSSRRPTMKTILRLFEEPDFWLKKQREREEFLREIGSKGETGLWRHVNSDTSETLVMDDF